MDIYWIKDKKKCGPSTVPDVVSLVQSGELTPETLGWHVGCSGWLPLRELPALSDFLNRDTSEPTPAATEDTGSSVDESKAGNDTLPPVPSVSSAPSSTGSESITFRVSLYKPGVGARLMARMVDMALYSVLVYAIVYMLRLEYSPYMLPASPVFWLGMIALETFCLRIFQTTPGKKLFNILVVELGPDGLSGVDTRRAFARSFMVFVGGLGMMVSFLPLVMGGISWYMLKKRGTTSWDARAGTCPVQLAPPGMMRYMLSIIVLIFCMQLLAGFFQPWFPDYLRDIERYAPEQAELLRPLLPAELVPTPPAAPPDTSVPTQGPKFLEL